MTEKLVKFELAVISNWNSEWKKGQNGNGKEFFDILNNNFYKPTNVPLNFNLKLENLLF